MDSLNSVDGQDTLNGHVSNPNTHPLKENIHVMDIECNKFDVPDTITTLEKIEASATVVLPSTSSQLSTKDGIIISPSSPIKRSSVHKHAKIKTGKFQIKLPLEKKPKRLSSAKAKLVIETQLSQSSQSSNHVPVPDTKKLMAKSIAIQNDSSLASDDDDMAFRMKVAAELSRQQKNCFNDPIDMPSDIHLNLQNQMNPRSAYKRLGRRNQLSRQSKDTYTYRKNAEGADVFSEVMDQEPHVFTGEPQEVIDDNVSKSMRKRAGAEINIETSAVKRAAGDQTANSTSLKDAPKISLKTKFANDCSMLLKAKQVDFVLPLAFLPVEKDDCNYKKICKNVYAGSVKLALKHASQCTCKIDDACGDNCINRFVFTECNSATCPCKENCRNRTIQKNDAAAIERFRPINKGWGVRANELIPKGKYILEYTGEVVNAKECRKNDNNFYCLNLGGGLLIDAHRMGNECRYVNHSCRPNSAMQKWYVNGLPRMALFAIEDIRAGGEISYDYGFLPYNGAQVCNCGEVNCRGFIVSKSLHIGQQKTKKVMKKSHSASFELSDKRKSGYKNRKNITKSGKNANDDMAVRIEFAAELSRQQKMDYKFEPYRDAQKCECGSQKCTGTIGQNSQGRSQLLNALQLTEATKNLKNNKSNNSTAKRILTKVKKQKQKNGSKVSAANHGRKSKEIKQKMAKNEKYNLRNKQMKVLPVLPTIPGSVKDAQAAQVIKPFEMTLIDENDKKRFIKVVYNASAAASAATSKTLNDSNVKKVVLPAKVVQYTLQLSDEMELYSTFPSPSKAESSNINKSTETEVDRGHLHRDNNLSFSEQCKQYTNDKNMSSLPSVDIKSRLGPHPNDLRALLSNKRESSRELRSPSSGSSNMAEHAFAFGGAIEITPKILQSRIAKFANSGEIVPSQKEKTKGARKLDFEAYKFRSKEVLVNLLDDIKLEWAENHDYFYVCGQLNSIEQDRKILP